MMQSEGIWWLTMQAKHLTATRCGRVAAPIHTKKELEQNHNQLTWTIIVTEALEMELEPVPSELNQQDKFFPTELLSCTIKLLENFDKSNQIFKGRTKTGAPKPQNFVLNLKKDNEEWMELQQPKWRV